MGVVGISLCPECFEDAEAARERFPVDEAACARGEKVVEFRRVAEDQIDAEADRHSFGVQGVFEQGLDFGRFEEFLECIASREHAIAEGSGFFSVKTLKWIGAG